MTDDRGKNVECDLVVVTYKTFENKPEEDG
jgi:hypothetical protein